MMETFGNWHIEEMPLQSPFFHGKVERFLLENGLRMETLDAYYTLQNPEGEILAGAGLKADVLKCLAVSSALRSEGLAAPLISHVISVAASKGITQLKVFTKPEHQALFESLGFKLLASAPEAILMENGRGLEQYCSYLRGLSCAAATGHPRIGVVVMNANPFTLGHQYLLEQASAQVDQLVVIPVKENLSAFSYEERREMIRSGAPEGVIVAEGSAYQISALTFPTYFLKDLSQAAQTQMRLDIDLFARHIAPALGATVRFVGSEPYDALTARYNEIMRERLNLVEIERLPGISASIVRKAHYPVAATMVPETTKPYLLSHLACSALRRELDCPLKPGLVGPDSNGAHPDMDYVLMQRSISALWPWFVRMAQASSVQELQQLGIQAEKAMLEATGGVNTHRGAIFALGLALYVREMEGADNETDMQKSLCKIAQTLSRNNQNNGELHFTHGADAVSRYGVKGAREMALEGYAPLWADWLPYYRGLSREEVAFSSASLRDPVRANAPEKATSFRLQKTLLRIMSTLDDTCVIHRVGYERAQEVKREAKGLLEEMPDQVGHDDVGQNVMADWIGHLKQMCDRYAAEGISPGGAADMLALTILIDSIIN
ncbi:MAG: GNAT family N-acetyltransferase [Bacteroidales bacterium]|nr:GNAT family N-acetyltransferase [Bacteroidales bacterium]